MIAVLRTEMKRQVWMMQARLGGRGGLPTRIYEVLSDDRHGSHHRANLSTAALKQTFAPPMAKVIRFPMPSMIPFYRM